MRRLLVWTWKEAREHAGRVRLLLLSIPVLTLLAGAIWSQELTESHGDELSFGFVAAALVLHGLVVASGLFASDVGESAPAPAQRLPGGLGAAFVAKGLTWFLTALLAVLVGTFATAGVMWLVGQPERAWDVLTPWHHSDGVQQAAFVAEALVYSACVALTAACVRHPGSAVAAGTILFGVLLGPVVLAWRADPRVFPLHAAQSLVLEGLMLVVLLLACATAWFVGRRRVASGQRAAVLAGGVIVALYGAAAVHAAGTIDGRREPVLESNDWCIESAWIGKGGHFAFVDVTRYVGAWPLTVEERDSYREVRRVDLRRGGWERVGRRGASLDILPHGAAGTLVPPILHHHERVVVCQPQDRLDAFTRPSEVLWFDGATGSLLHEGLSNYPDPREVGFLRDLARDYSGVRDAQGRRTWLYDGFLEREGGGAPIGVPQIARGQGRVFPIVGQSGAWWLRLLPGNSKRQAPFERFTWIDAETGRVLECVQEELPPAYPLVGGRLLVQRSPTSDIRTATWQVLDLATGAAQPAPGAPSGRPRTEHIVCALDGDRMLVSSKRDEGLSIAVWDVATGVRRPLDVPGGSRAIEHVGSVGRSASGHVVLRLGYGKDGGDAWALVAPDGSSLRVLVSARADGDWLQPLAVEPDGSVLCLAIRHQKRWSQYAEFDRIVRIGPELDRNEILFPRTKE